LVGTEIEDDELLDMLDNQQIFMTMISSHSIRLWKKIYRNIKIHSELVIENSLASSWAVQKNAPKLMASLNRFIKHHKKGTKLGNILHRR